MRVRVRIPRHVKDYFDKYGNLSYCMNRLFNELGEAWIELPCYGSREKYDDVSSTMVDITSPYYIAYRDSFRANSPAVSPSRLLIHACETDYCATNEWPIYTSHRDKITSLLNDIQSMDKTEVEKLIKTLQEKYL